MGQSFNKLKAGSEEEKKKDKMVKGCYENHFKDKTDCSKDEFYEAICRAVEKLNEDLRYTQVKAIDKDKLLKEYENYRKREDGGKPTEEEFKKTVERLQNELQFTGVGIKDTLLYIFGVPASATFMKNAIMPSLVSNEILIPSMTSLTVLVLAKLNKI